MGWESSDLTVGPSFKVKPWFTGFGELFFRWIQICIGEVGLVIICCNLVLYFYIIVLFKLKLFSNYR